MITPASSSPSLDFQNFGLALGESVPVKEFQGDLQRLRSTFIESFNHLVLLKDLSVRAHSDRLADWSVRLAQRLGLDRECQQEIRAAALLHDLGKVGIPDAILQKPGKLTPEERLIINKHPEYGWSALCTLPGFERISLYVLHHHERMDGKGYPAGLKGDEIPFGSRIVCVIDAFDAMISDRCYRKGLPLHEALHRLRASSGSQFDPEVVAHFVDMITRSVI